jgi:hypothetical protein
MIPQRNLSLLSNRIARAGGRSGGRLEQDCCIAWFWPVFRDFPVGAPGVQWRHGDQTLLFRRLSILGRPGLYSGQRY